MRIRLNIIFLLEMRYKKRPASADLFLRFEKQLLYNQFLNQGMVDINQINAFLQSTQIDSF